MKKNIKNNNNNDKNNKKNENLPTAGEWWDIWRRIEWGTKSRPVGWFQLYLFIFTQ